MSETCAALGANCENNCGIALIPVENEAVAAAQNDGFAVEWQSIVEENAPYVALCVKALQVKGIADRVSGLTGGHIDPEGVRRLVADAQAMQEYANHRAATDALA